MIESDLAQARYQGKPSTIAIEDRKPSLHRCGIRQRADPVPSPSHGRAERQLLLQRHRLDIGLEVRSIGNVRRYLTVGEVAPNKTHEREKQLPRGHRTNRKRTNPFRRCKGRADQNGRRSLRLSRNSWAETGRLAAPCPTFHPRDRCRRPAPNRSGLTWHQHREEQSHRRNCCSVRRHGNSVPHIVDNSSRRDHFSPIIVIAYTIRVIKTDSIYPVLFATFD